MLERKNERERRREGGKEGRRKGEKERKREGGREKKRKRKFPEPMIFFFDRQS